MAAGRSTLVFLLLLLLPLDPELAAAPAVVAAGTAPSLG